MIRYSSVRSNRSVQRRWRVNRANLAANHACCIVFKHCNLFITRSFKAWIQLYFHCLISTGSKPSWSIIYFLCVTPLLYHYSVITLISYGPQNQCYNEVPVYYFQNRFDALCHIRSLWVISFTERTDGVENSFDHSARRPILASHTFEKFI